MHAVLCGMHDLLCGLHDLLRGMHAELRCTHARLLRVHSCMQRSRACTHSSQPHLGDNAVFRMARVLSVLERYGRDIVPKLASHPLCGHPTLSVGLISGGISVNTGTIPSKTMREAVLHLSGFYNKNFYTTVFQINN